MGNHCVESVCYECGYYECTRCGDSGIGQIPSGPMRTNYLKNIDCGRIHLYEKCHNCGKVAMR